MFIFMFLEISPHRRRSSVAIRPPPVLWASRYWMASGVHPLSRCESRASSIHLSQIRCAQFS